MRLHADSEGVQCNACLAIMALVRGEGEVCIQNQWRVAKAGGVEAMAGSMKAFPKHPMVQLSTLLCIIPLCLGATWMLAVVSVDACECVDVQAAVHCCITQPTSTTLSLQKTR